MPYRPTLKKKKSAVKRGWVTQIRGGSTHSTSTMLKHSPLDQHVVGRMYLITVTKNLGGVATSHSMIQITYLECSNNGYHSKELHTIFKSHSSYTFQGATRQMPCSFHRMNLIVQSGKGRLQHPYMEITHLQNWNDQYLHLLISMEDMLRPQVLS